MVEADDNHVAVGFTRQVELVKASANQARNEWKLETDRLNAEL